MRLISLDVLRGLTVAGMILVNSAAAMKWGAEADVAGILLHKSWDGLTLADLVFPGFLTMVGIAIPFSLRDSTPGQQGRALARAGRLILLGLVLSNLYWAADFAASEFRVFGVLQRIGLVYGACALLYLACGPRVRMALIAVLLIGYWPFTLLPALDGLPNDLWQRGHNFAASLDRVVLGTHLYVQGPEGYDPEGILGTLPAIAQGLIGVALGEMLRDRSGGRTRALAIAGGAMVALGLAWSFAFPIVKDIWSSSFVLVTAGITTLALAALHPLLDREGRTPGLVATAMIAFGTNAIAAYTLHQVTAGVVAWDLLLIPFHATRATLGDPLASLIPVALYMVLIWAAMEWLRRRNWIIKI
ncbi:heparan-alpha-glucosaminide N-acetyltransferase domain-containing protein [Sphingomonas sp. R647]|uniref:acyltransferase family protein n=1 Tax=Sphingomonas sp. R647 TaxID=2875233 RepID=UPI001CD4E149|nr:heparan-alpha-glucosaminide N-acetyltransferase domain-containing protein [Sphingomonas sp. R647]MCA1199587.1 heparan-alpha-glucosaminide N-acetyltransferase domain-containing protein [Sphingomonas sp. R647]